MWDGYLVVDGQEVINVARTEAYASEARWFKPLFKNDDLPLMLEQTYTTPAVDLAPWYDPAMPESNDFWGFYPLDISGIEDSSRSSTVIESTVDGAIPGRIRHGSKTAVFNGLLLARNEKGAAYGMMWLRRALLGDHCDLDNLDVGLGVEAQLLSSVPELEPGQDPVLTLSDYLRTLRRFSVNDGPRPTAKRTMFTCEGEVWTVTFTAVVGDPHIYGSDRPILQGWLDGAWTTSLEFPNLQPHSSFEDDTTGWAATGGTLTFESVPDPPSGAVVARLTRTSGSGDTYFQTADTDFLIPIDAGQIGDYLTAAAEMRWIGANTPSTTVRLNVYFLDAGLSVVAGGTFAGDPHTGDTDWARIVTDSIVIPASSVWARLRPIISGAVTGDSIEVDSLYATIGADLGAGPYPEWVPNEGEYTVNPDPWAAEAVEGTADNDATPFTEVACGDDTWEPIYDPLCPPLIAPPTPPSVPLGCLDIPEEWDRRVVVIPAANVPEVGTVAPVVSLYAPDVMRGVRIRFYSDPTEDLDPSNEPCSWNVDMVISYLPAEATMIIDSAAEEVWVETVSGQRRRADALVVSTESKPFEWPLLSCGDQQIMTLDTEVGSQPPTVDLTFVPRVV